MKLLNYICSTVSLLMLIAFGALHFKHQHTAAILVGSDITGIKPLTPEFDKILTRFNLTEDIWQGVDATHLIISDMRLTKTEHVSLPLRSRLSNEIEREHEVDAFTASFQALSRPIDTVTVEKKHSSIYLPLAEQLNVLSKSTAETREAYIASDLKEKTKELSLYDTIVFNEYKAHPEQLIEYFTNLHPLGDLTNIKIWLIYAPKDIREDEDFAFLAWKVYKPMLERAHATVVITSSL